MAAVPAYMASQIPAQLASVAMAALISNTTSNNFNNSSIRFLDSPNGGVPSI